MTSRQTVNTADAGHDRVATQNKLDSLWSQVLQVPISSGLWLLVPALGQDSKRTGQGWGCKALHIWKVLRLSHTQLGTCAVQENAAEIQGQDTFTWM